MDALEARHLADLTFREVSRSVRALSSAYVERRLALADRKPLSGRGKRAAFAMFYAPLHYLLVEHIVRSLPGAGVAHTIIDLGCGTGAAGAAWAIHCERTPAIIGIDRNAWALGETVQTYRMFQLRGRVRHEHIQTARLPKTPAGVLAAFALNELADTDRETVLERLIRRQQDHLLIVEPIAGFVARSVSASSFSANAARTPAGLFCNRAAWMCSCRTRPRSWNIRYVCTASPRAHAFRSMPIIAGVRSQ